MLIRIRGFKTFVEPDGKLRSPSLQGEQIESIEKRNKKLVTLNLFVESLGIGNLGITKSVDKPIPGALPEVSR